MKDPELQSPFNYIEVFLVSDAVFFVLYAGLNFQKVCVNLGTVLIFIRMYIEQGSCFQLAAVLCHHFSRKPLEGPMLPLDSLPTTLGMFGTAEGTELAGPGTSDTTRAVPVVVTSPKM